MNTNVMYQLTYGLFVLTARMGGVDNGCIVNTVQQVTSSPNRITVAVNKANYTHDMILSTGKFTVSILSEKAQFALFQRFGFQSGRTVDKFDGFSAVRRAGNGRLYLTEGTNAYLAATVEQTIDLGTHTLFIAAVEEGESLDKTPSVTYTYYQENIKPKPQPKPQKSQKTVWRCKICGYEYEGEELPEDFICPLCKHPASDFEKVEG